MGFSRLRPRDGTGFSLLLVLLLIACQHHLPAPEVTMSSLAPLENIPTQRLKAGQRLALDLSLFFDVEAVHLDLVNADGIDAAWTDDTHQTLTLEAPSGEATHLGHIRLRSAPRAGGGGAIEVDVPVAVEQSQWHVFEFRPEADVESVSVAGDFNGWNATADPMLDEDGDGIHRARVEMQPGRHLYKFVVDGEWMPDPNNPDRTHDEWNNSILRVDGSALGAAPTWARLRQSGGAGGELRLHFLTQSPADGHDRAPQLPRVQAFLDHRLLPSEAVEVRIAGGDLTSAEIVVEIPADTQAEQLLVQGLSAYGDLLPEQLILLRDSRPVVQENPDGDSWRATVLYYALVDRFAGGDPGNNLPVPDPEGIYEKTNWMGGDLQGVLNKIEEGYFDDLGVTCLWLSPLSRQTPQGHQEYPPPHRYYTAYHGYWPIRSREVEPRFGDEALLRRVVDAAHARGMRVILDFVSNHVHEDHPMVEEHPEWFGEVELPDGTMNIQMFDEHRFTTWFDIFLPTIDYEAPGAIEEMTDVAMWWLETFNLDGFRHDAVKHIPHEFWTTLTRRVREYEARTGREIYQVGETISDRETIMEYCRGGMLDGQFDFPSYWPFRQAIATRQESMSDFAEAVDQSIREYGPTPLHSALIGNHDVPRFMALADGDLTGNEPVEEQRAYGFEHDVTVDDPISYDLLEIAFAYLMTQPQIPMIYYGDEVGLTGAQDPDNRRLMEFEGLSERRLAIRQSVERLAQLRHSHPALWTGDLITVEATDDVWVYARVNFDEIVLVALNRADTPADLALALPPVLTPRAGQVFRDLLSEDQITVGDDGALSLPVEPRSFRLLHRNR